MDLTRYEFDTPPEKLLADFKAELEMFQKPKVDPDDIDTAELKDIVKDIHKAIYGNGGPTKGMIFKMAESHTLLVDLISKHAKCRTQVVEHLQDADERALLRKHGLVAVCRKHPKLALAVSVILFFGLSTLWSVVIQERQTTKIEQVVLTVLNKQIPGLVLLPTPPPPVPVKKGP